MLFLSDTVPESEAIEVEMEAQDTTADKVIDVTEYFQGVTINIPENKCMKLIWLLMNQWILKPLHLLIKFQLGKYEDPSLYQHL